MIRKVIKIGGIITSSIVTTITFIFGESLLITVIYLLGPILSFIVLDLLFTVLCFGIIYIYYKERRSGNKLIRKIQTWIKRKENNLTIYKSKLFKYGKFLGLMLFGIAAGPVPTSIFIGLLGYEKKAYVISAFINILFFLTWINIYNGGIELIKKIIR